MRVLVGLVSSEGRKGRIVPHRCAWLVHGHLLHVLFPPSMPLSEFSLLVRTPFIWKRAYLWSHFNLIVYVNTIFWSTEGEDFNVRVWTFREDSWAHNTRRPAFPSQNILNSQPHFSAAAKVMLSQLPVCKSGSQLPHKVLPTYVRYPGGAGGLVCQHVLLPAR